MERSVQNLGWNEQDDDNRAIMKSLTQESQVKEHSINSTTFPKRNGPKMNWTE